MEVYILDNLYRRSLVVDRFVSLIWTERWKEIGDFELVLPSTTMNRAIFNPDVPLALKGSKRVMQVETIEDTTDTDGRLRLKVKGRSIERLLEDRMVISLDANGVPLPKTSYSGTPVGVIQSVFTDICRNGLISSADIIPLLVDGTAYPAENIPAPVDIITVDQEPDTLAAVFKNICDIYDIGIRLYRNGDTGQLFFNVYTGNDRTTAQKILPPVIFSPMLETVQSTTELITIEKAKNIAYVFSEQGFKIVAAPGTDLTVSGTKRRVLMVKADKLVVTDADGNELVPTAAEISDFLTQVGTDELAKNRPLRGFDGEINQHSPYRYGVHYELGDLVEMRGADGSGNTMRVTEQIFAHDDAGERSYPTLTIESFIIPGTWDSWLGNKNWADMGATEYWNTQP